MLVDGPSSLRGWGPVVVSGVLPFRPSGIFRPASHTRHIGPWGFGMFSWRRRPGRHRLGATGLTWAREHVAVAAALEVPAVARRGLFETFFATPRHTAFA